MNLQIKHRLTALVAIAMAAMIGVAVFSYAQLGTLDASLRSTIARSAAVLDTADKARAAQVTFKIQVQEWKNTLLRGKDPEQFAKYSGRFNERDEQVRALLQEVRENVADLGIQDRVAIDEVIAAFDKLGPAYRRALEQYDASTLFPAQTVDKLVKGIDRPPTKAIDGMVDAILAFAAEARAQEIEAADALRSTESSALLTATALAAILLVALALLIVRSISRPLAALGATMSEITENHDMTRRAQDLGNDEIGRIGTTFNTMMAQLQNIIGEVRDTTHSVGTSIEHLNAAARTVADVSQHQTDAVASSAASVEELSTAIATAADTASEVRAQADQSAGLSADGAGKVSHLAAEITRIQEHMHEVAKTVDEFARSTEAITGMTQEVREIADQTNLLALNAAIEAARAGESGRGFAVVADEVRKLAEKSGSSASEIDTVTRSIMTQSQAVQGAIRKGEQAISASNALALDVKSVLESSSDAAGRSQHGVSEINAAIDEQKITSTEIARNMEQISNTVQENDEAARKVRDEAAGLASLTAKLQDTVAAFRIR